MNRTTPDIPINVIEDSNPSSLLTLVDAQGIDPSRTPLDTSSPEDHNFAMLPLPALLFLTPFMLAIIAVSVVSNLLVLLSYKPHMLFVDAQSLYLLHLAVSDLLISVVCMPLHLVSTLWSAGWPLGRGTCQFYTAMQLTLLNMTTLVLVLVALDGLLQAEEGVRSTGREAKRKAYAWLALCWLLAVAVNVPGTLSWGVLQGYPVVHGNVCRPDFYKSVSHVLFVQVWSFFLPVLVLSIINTRLYLHLRRLSLTILTLSHAIPSQLGSGQGVSGKLKENLETHKQTAASDSSIATGEFHDIAVISLQPPDERPGQKHAATPNVSHPVYVDKSPLKSCSMISGGMSARSLSTGQIGKTISQVGKRLDRIHSPNRRSQSSSDIKAVRSPKLDLKLAAAEGIRVTSGSDYQSSAAGDGQESGSPKAGSLAPVARHNASLERPYRLKRVAIILFTLVLILVVCWLPYSVAFLVRSLCQDCVHPVLYSILVWVLYVKSCINPFLYAYNTFAFRNRFRRLLVRIFPVKNLRRMTTDRVSNERASILN